LINIIRLLLRHGDDMTCPRWLTRLATITFGLYRGWRIVEVVVHVAPRWFSAAGRPTRQRGQAVSLVAATAAAVALTVFLPGHRRLN
jgi:hypothetical protein